MKKFLLRNEIALYLILVVFILLMMNLSSDNTAKYNLSSYENQGKNVMEYSPSLTLGKGKYDITLRTNTNEQIKLNVCSNTNPDLYQTTFSGNQKTFTLELSEKQNGIAFSTEGKTAVLTNVEIKSGSLLYTDTIFVALCILIFLLLMVYVKSKEEAYEKMAIFIVICAGVVASYPLFTSYLYSGHDLNFHLWRIEGIADGLRSGQFPVRIHPTHNNGYGYITASVYPELFLYFPAVLRLLGVSLATAYKALLVAMNIMTALIMYYSAKGITKSKLFSVMAAVIYTMSTWRLFCLYPRAAIGEGMAMSFLPLVVLGLYHVLKGDQKKWYILAIAYTCIFQVHVITTVLTAILSVVIALIFVKDCFKEKRYISIFKAIIVTVLLNLWYLIPFIRYYFSLDMVIRQPRVNTEFWQNAIIPAELFNIFNDSFGYSLLLDRGIKGNMSVSLGFPISVCLICAVAYFIFNKKDKIENESFTKAYFICGIAFLFAATTLFPWEPIQKNVIFNKFADLVRMPWRFLSMASPLITIAAVHTMTIFKPGEKAKKISLLAVCMVCTLFMVHFGQAFTTNTTRMIEGVQSPAVSGSIGLDKEYLVKGTDEKLLLPEKYVASESVKVTSFEKKGTNIKLTLANSSKDAYVEVPLLYYPGYTAENSDGEKLETVNGDNNVLRVNLNGASGDIFVKYTGFIYFRIAELISLFTLLLLIFGKKLKKEIKKREK